MLEIFCWSRERTSHKRGYWAAAHLWKSAETATIPPDSSPNKNKQKQRGEFPLAVEVRYFCLQNHQSFLLVKPKSNTAVLDLQRQGRKDRRGQPPLPLTCVPARYKGSRVWKFQQQQRGKYTRRLRPEITSQPPSDRRGCYTPPPLVIGAQRPSQSGPPA